MTEAHRRPASPLPELRPHPGRLLHRARGDGRRAGGRLTGVAHRLQRRHRPLRDASPPRFGAAAGVRRADDRVDLRQLPPHHCHRRRPDRPADLRRPGARWHRPHSGLRGRTIAADHPGAAADDEGRSDPRGADPHPQPDGGPRHQHLHPLPESPKHRRPGARRRPAAAFSREGPAPPLDPRLESPHQARGAADPRLAERHADRRAGCCTTSPIWRAAAAT